MSARPRWLVITIAVLMMVPDLLSTLVATLLVLAPIALITLIVVDFHVVALWAVPIVTVLLVIASVTRTAILAFGKTAVAYLGTEQLLRGANAAAGGVPATTPSSEK